MIKKNNWFLESFGFIEYNDYNNNKKKFEKLFKEGNEKKINKISVGDFKLYNCNDLYKLLPKKRKNGIIYLENIIDDIKNINNICEEYSTIQIASQLNCLEMINPSITPENGITIYENDLTQGPICVMCTPSAIAYRNYLYNGGQTKNNQVDLSFELLALLKKYNYKINWKSTNGYLMIDSNDILLKINNLLSNEDLREEAKNKLNAGVHYNIGVFNNNKSINHILCSGLPINYHNNIDDELWIPLSKLFLEALYEITLLSACYSNIKNKCNSPCYLTLIGEGVFGMDPLIICDSIKKACYAVSKRGYFLNVYIVHYNHIPRIYKNIPKKYS